MIKRLLFVIICSILAGALTGCGIDDYAIEKQYWRAQKQAEKIFKNPHSSPPSELERVVGIFNNFIKNYPEKKVAVEAEFTIARIYIAKEEYDKAREHLKSTLKKHGSFDEICAQAVFLIGNSYQLQDKWGLALEQYKKIMQDYPATLKSIDTPVYIAQYYKAKFQPDKMKGAYLEAISHYKRLSAKYPDSPFAYVADTASANCYVALQDWQAAIDTFNLVIEKYKGKAGNLDSLLMNIAFIYNNQLKNKTKAKEALERLIKDYPHSKLIKNATALLKEVEKK